MRDDTAAVKTGFSPLGDPPRGYPTLSASDQFSEFCFAEDYATRREALRRHCLRNPSPHNAKAPWMELVRLQAGEAVHWGMLRGACEFVNSRQDCADFYLHGLLRFLWQFSSDQRVPMRVLAETRRAVLDFKYWPDEPGQDSMCTWTENHQILFASAGLLAGRFFPEALFTNSGMRGEQLAGISLARVRRWLNLRTRSGFSEWLSNVYYDEDLTALFNLMDFAGEEDIRESARFLIHNLLEDIARFSFRGAFAATHGRCYEQMKKDPAMEHTSEIAKLVFGRGIFSEEHAMSGIAALLSPAFRPAKALFDLGQDDRAQEHRLRMGIRIADGQRWGIGYRDPEDGMVWLSLEAYAHPRTLLLTLRMFDKYRWWGNRFFAPFRKFKPLLSALRHHPALLMLARSREKDLCRNTREEVNIYAWKTPDGMLSSAQDYRGGYGGDQQSIWQATLGGKATCFTTHPARLDGPSPSYWTGSGSLPRVAQFQDTLFCLYAIDVSPGLYLTNRLAFTHAWLPRDEFEESRVEGGWIFLRRGKGYLALTARNGMHWQGERGQRGQVCEVVSQGRENIWICQLGREGEDGSFAEFCQRIQKAALLWKRGLSVEFHAPGVGKMQFAWKGALRVEGRPVELREYPRTTTTRYG